MYRLAQLFRNEPAVIAGVVQALFALAVLFGLPLNAEQVAGSAGVIALLLGLFYVRPNVTPTNGGTP